jgi:phosphoribosyl 1,2-cyclic phosphodiesterase
MLDIGMEVCRMKVDILASGSKGNCIALTSGDQTILIDAGIPKTKIEKRLLEVGIRPDEVRSIFVTHGHGDHIAGLPFANKYRIKVFAPEAEWQRIEIVDEDLRRVIGVHEPFYGCGYETHAFHTFHNTFDSFGYAVTFYGNTAAEDTKVSICLDTGKVDAEMINGMKGSDIYIIEANHDVDMQVSSDRPESVIARNLSDLGHLSNDQTAAALQQLIEGCGEHIYLTHLSGTCNMPTLAEMTVKAALKRRGFIAGEHYTLEVVSE